MLNLVQSGRLGVVGFFCAALSTSGVTLPSFVPTMIGSAVFSITSFVAGQTEARPRPGARPQPGARPRPGAQPRPGAAPRRHHYYEKQRRDDFRDSVRRRHALGFLYVATRPCNTTVVLDDGVTYYYCDNVYYRPYIDRGTTIYVIR